MNTEIKAYAPVVIPTLNRYEHFKRCLESLERCSGADYTEVYVALDYPPSDKYRKGWELIDAYLHEKEKKNGFKVLHVVRRDHNYGTCSDNSNDAVLIRDIKPLYDSYIFTEDDNEFSPCYLEFMNKCLERFYDDDRIFLVCGYNYNVKFPDTYKNNFYITKWGCPWGIAKWFHKNKDLDPYYNENKLRSLIKNDITFNILMKRNPASIQNIISMLKRGAIYGDAVMGSYSVLFDKYCIMPRLSMVRNWGNDGTGDHSQILNQSQNAFYSQQEICKDTTFEFTDDIFTYEPVYLERNHFKPSFTLKEWLRERYLYFVFKIDLYLLRKFDYLPKSKYI